MQIDSHLRLFADDCLLYEEVNDSVMAESLQKNLNLLGEWAEKWQMSFNVSKCYHMSAGPRGNNPVFQYKLNGEILKDVTHHAYLGIEFDCKLKWEQHVTKIVNKDNRSLAFLRRNLGMCPKNIKCAAYFTLVRPHLEYSACAWDPYLKGQKDKIEKVQKKAARFVENNYCREPGTMTKMLEDLHWPTLETRRKYMRLVMFYKITNNEIDMELPPYIMEQRRATRSSGAISNNFIPLQPRLDCYKFSFYVRTIVEWNMLPPELKSQTTLKLFKSAFRQHLNLD